MTVIKMSAISCAALLLVAGCTGGSPTSVPATTSTTASAVDAGADDSQFPIGSTTPFSVYAHCGVEFVKIGDQMWRTELRDDGQGNPPEGWPQNIQGQLTMVSKDEAVFSSDEIGPDLSFRPAPDARKSCA